MFWLSGKICFPKNLLISTCGYFFTFGHPVRFWCCKHLKFTPQYIYIFTRKHRSWLFKCMDKKIIWEIFQNQFFQKQLDLVRFSFLFPNKLVWFLNRSYRILLAKLGLAFVSIFLGLATLYLAIACLCRGLVDKFQNWLQTNRQTAVFIEVLHN